MSGRLKVVITNRFEKTLALMRKRGKDASKLQLLLDLLVSRSDIPVKYKNHKLKGNFKNRWECHIEPDWLHAYGLWRRRWVAARAGLYDLSWQTAD